MGDDNYTIKEMFSHFQEDMEKKIITIHDDIGVIREFVENIKEDVASLKTSRSNFWTALRVGFLFTGTIFALSVVIVKLWISNSEQKIRTTTQAAIVTELESGNYDIKLSDDELGRIKNIINK